MFLVSMNRQAYRELVNAYLFEQCEARLRPFVPIFPPPQVPITLNPPPNGVVYRVHNPRSSTLPCDEFMSEHLLPQDQCASDPSGNRFDFLLLRGVVNPREGMKMAPSGTIPCKYGVRCFRKDCRFMHTRPTLDSDARFS